MNQTNENNMSPRFRGCMLGLAIGDALGAPVEFMQLDEIKKRYGEQGVTGFEPWGGFPAGTYTDDTQMSLATAEGIIRARRADPTSDPTSGLYCWPEREVWRAYLEWYKTQSDPKEKRAPGNTCLNALKGGRMGTVEKPINDSKGCGGVMRVAPAGLVFAYRAFDYGVSFAAMTHGHPSGYLSAGFLAALVSYIVQRNTLLKSIDGKNELMKTIGFSRDKLAKLPHCKETLEKVDSAIELAKGETPVEKAISILGQGWTGEEALAIAIFCSLRFQDDFRKAVLAAVNHSGDSDTTGSITGAIMGTLLGEESIPKEWIQQIEGRERLLDISNELRILFPPSEPFISDNIVIEINTTEKEIEEVLKKLKP